MTRKQEYTSKDTSINRVNAIYTQLTYKKGARVLDYGGGKYDTNKEYLAKQGIQLDVYDPYNRSEQHNTKVIHKYKAKAPDYIVCSNVLNVIKEKEIIVDILNKIDSLCDNNTLVHIAVYEGDGSGIGKVSKDDCWQRNAKASSYIPILKRVFAMVKKKGNMFICEPFGKGFCMICYNKYGDRERVIRLKTLDEAKSIWYAEKEKGNPAPTVYKDGERVSGY